MYFLKIHRFHASFFEFYTVLRASASLLCPLLGNFFKNLRTIVGRYSLELLHLVEAGVQRNRDLIVFSDANLLNELLQNGAAFIVVGGVVNIRPCKQLVADVVATLCCFGSFFVFFLCLHELLFQSFQSLSCLGHQCAQQFFVQGTHAPDDEDGFGFQVVQFFLLAFQVFLDFLDLLLDAGGIVGLDRFQQLLPGNLPELCEDLPDNFFHNGIQLGNTIAGLPIAVARMPDLIKAAIPRPDFFHRMPIGVGVCPSAAGQAQAVAAVTAVDQPGQQGFGAGAQRGAATLAGTRRLT